MERHFHIPEERTDQELEQVMKNRPPGEDEDELFNDSAEVWCSACKFWITLKTTL